MQAEMKKISPHVAASNRKVFANLALFLEKLATAASEKKTPSVSGRNSNFSVAMTPQKAVQVRISQSSKRDFDWNQ